MNSSISDIANLALDELPAPSITSISDEVPRAEIIRRQWPRAIGLLLEQEWSFQIKRQTLVGVTNTRTSMWAHAYAVPANMGYPLRLRPYAGWGYLGWDANTGLTFDIEGGIIWSNSQDVVLEYVSNSADFAQMTASFQEALIFALAARIALPITKDETKRDKLYQKAELFRDRALAADANRTSGGNRYGEFVPDSLRAMIDFGDELFAPQISGALPGYTGVL